MIEARGNVPDEGSLGDDEPHAAFGAAAVIRGDVGTGNASRRFQRVMGAITIRFGSVRPLS